MVIASTGTWKHAQYSRFESQINTVMDSWQIFVYEIPRTEQTSAYVTTSKVVIGSFSYLLTYLDADGADRSITSQKPSETDITPLYGAMERAILVSLRRVSQ